MIRIAAFISIAAIALLFSFAPARFASESNAAAAAPISITATNESVRDVLLRLGKQYGVNVVVNAEVHGTISVSLHGVTLDEALTAIVTPLGYTFRHYGAIVFVGAVKPATHAAPVPATPGVAPAVMNVSVISVDRAAGVLRDLYPNARITVDRSANAIIVVARADETQAMRAVLSGIDVANPMRPTTEAIALHAVDPKTMAAKIAGLYSGARVSAGPGKSILVTATPQDMSQIKSLVAAVDVTQATPAPTRAPAEAVRVTQARPQDVARAVAHQFPDVRTSVAGSSVVFSGPPDEVEKAKALVALIDNPPPNTRYTQVYRLHNVDAGSVGALISKSFRNAQVTVDTDLNALSVTATSSEQQRIADAVAQLDSASAAGGATYQQPGNVANAGVGPGGSNVEVLTLKAAVPGQNQAQSTSATDIATAVAQALQQSAPDLHITVPNNSTQLVLTGSPYSIRLAKQLIDQLDVSPPLVVLDTELLELDENVAKNLGLQFSQPLLSTTYSEIQPTSQPLLGIQPFQRTPLSIPVALNALVQNGTARVLADPRITTISGRTATIRAGDNISILTTVGGGSGVVATQQVQSFQTGVTLDITPVVNAGDSISVTLHPVVNSLAGLNNGVPQISTRDTQTTVNLLDNQTLVIGGLIQENTTRTDTKLPLLGDVPLLGHIFHNQSYNHTRNELVIVVTPHLVTSANAAIPVGPALPGIPTPHPLPTLPPGTRLPSPSGQLPNLQPSPGVVESTPVPSPKAAPVPTPTAFARANVFTFGEAPANNYAGPSDPVQIFYASFSPTVVSAGTLVTLNVITTTNVVRVTIGAGLVTTSLSKVAPGKWQGRFNFNVSGLPVGQSGVQLTLSASRSDGASAAVGIPISVTP